jgi:hypothetical protein
MMTEAELNEAEQLISTNWNKVNFLEEEIERLSHFNFGKGKKRVYGKIDGNIVSLEREKRVADRFSYAQVTRRKGEYEARAGSNPTVYKEEFLTSTNFKQIVEYLLFAFVTKGEHFPDERTAQQIVRDIKNRWKKVNVLEDELDKYKKGDISINNKKVEFSIKEDLVSLQKLLLLNEGERGRFYDAQIAKIRKFPGGYLVRGAQVDAYKELFSNNLDKNLKEAIKWAVESRIIPTCGTRALDDEHDVKEFHDKRISAYLDRNWAIGANKISGSLLFLPLNSDEGLEFSLIGEKPCRFKISTSLEKIRVIETAFLSTRLPCCHVNTGVIIKSKREKAKHTYSMLQQTISVPHAVEKITPKIASQMKFFLEKTDMSLTPAEIKKRNKEFIGLVCVSGPHENGNMDYAAVWKEKSNNSKGILLFEHLVSTGKLEVEADPDKVEPILDRINKGSNISANAYIRLIEAWEIVKKQAAEFAYTTHVLDTLGVD